MAQRSSNSVGRGTPWPPDVSFRSAVCAFGACFSGATDLLAVSIATS